MKQFLYLDIDIVNSIIAQSGQGLIQSLSNEQVYSDTESDSSKIATNIRFDFVDFDYLEGLFKKEGIIDFIKKNTAEQIEAEAEKIKEEYNREQLRKAGMRFKNEIKKAIAVIDKQFDDIAIIIKALRGLIPYNRMLISNDGYLIPLNTKYFRVDPIDLGFKYGGEITYVGMITNIIGEDTNPNDNKNVFATLQFTANEVLRSILPTNENNLCVVHPIAIYYGS